MGCLVPRIVLVLDLPKTNYSDFAEFLLHFFRQLHGFALVCHTKITDCTDFEPQPLERFYVKHFKAVFCEDKGKS